MATNVFMPALGMAQETGTLVRWLKREGESVKKGEPLAEIMTDKATVELEAPADGVLAGIAAAQGQEIPVGQVIATVLRPGDSPPGGAGALPSSVPEPTAPAPSPPAPIALGGGGTASAAQVVASPLASRIATEHRLDLSAIPVSGRRIEKADVLAYLESRRRAEAPAANGARLAPASPKARRLARERGTDIAAIAGTGPAGAVLTADVLAAAVGATTERAPAADGGSHESAVGTLWRIMAERTTQSWTSVPHFFLLRDVNASRLMAWREQARRRGVGPITYTDLLVKAVAMTLRAHPRLNASWRAGTIVAQGDINVGVAVAVEDGLVVPVIHRADRLSLAEITQRREEIVARAQAGKVRPDDIASATFTISNLGMYGIDAFNAIISAPQAAILAVGRIADRVVPVHGAPSVQPMMTLSLSCDHRVVDGARGAQFLGALAELIEEPLALLE
jgi:pyruvate dehydrogenase E2 component (dihydrolipoamide acetyltransferase)